MDARPYLAAFAVITLPNVLFATALLFAVAVLTRNAIATYSAAVVLYILYFVCSALTGSPLMAGIAAGRRRGTLPSLLDPFALTAFFDATRYWTAAEKNARFIPLDGGLCSIAGSGSRPCSGSWRSPTADSASGARRPPFRPERAGREQSAARKPPWSDGRRSVPRAPRGSRHTGLARGSKLRALLTKSTLLLLLLWLGWRSPRSMATFSPASTTRRPIPPPAWFSRRSGHPRRSSARFSSSITERSCSGASSDPAWRRSSTARRSPVRR